MNLISAYQISKSYASKNLFKNISFAIDDKQRIGLIGPNGAGKTTLMNILAKRIEPDSGKISFSNGLRLGWLEQKPKFNADETIYDSLMSSVEDAYEGNDIALCYQLIAQFNLDLEGDKEFRKVSSLSGGWQKKVALARELMKRPNLLLLDEPTNHLDIESILWLEEYIQKQNELSFVIVTHDRAFLQNTCNVIFDLDRKNPDGLIKSFGSYMQFLETKSMIMDSQMRLEEKKRNTMLIEKDWLARGPQARLTKQKARIERAHQLIDQVDKLETQNQNRKLDFDFGKQESSPKKLIELEGVSKNFGERMLVSKLNAMIRPKTRIGLLGRNGCGKSTLIKILMGKEPPSSGKVFVNQDIQICYFEQGKETLNSNVSLFKTICPDGDYVHLHGTPVFAKSYLSRFHFSPQQMDLPVAQLSGGEQSRLLIAKLMLNPAHVLILDEPTNDLDIETLDVLTDCLSDFEGALILVSHDRFFLDQNANELWAFTENEEGEIIKFSDYNQWQNWFDDVGKKINRLGAGGSGSNLATPLASEKVSSAKDAPKTKKLSSKEQKEFDTIELRILEKETAMGDRQKQLMDPSIASDFKKIGEVSAEVGKMESEIKELYARWQFLEEKTKN